MSPEQARGTTDADERSDVYSVGVVLYEALSGRLPFEAPNLNDLLFKIALSKPVPLTKMLPDLDPDFAAIVSKAMAKEPQKRFQDVIELGRALDEWMVAHGQADLTEDALSPSGRARKGGSSVPLLEGAPAPEVRNSFAMTGQKSWTQSSLRATSELETKRRKRTAALWIGGLASLATLFLIAGFTFAGSGKRSAATATTAVPESAIENTMRALEPPTPTRAIAPVPAELTQGAALVAPVPNGNGEDDRVPVEPPVVEASATERSAPTPEAVKKGPHAPPTPLAAANATPNASASKTTKPVRATPRPAAPKPLPAVGKPGAKPASSNVDWGYGGN